MKLKIIVVDDHAFFRKGVIMTINRLKYAEVVGEASNGIELLEEAKLKKPDVVIMDIKMPEMDGIEAAKQLHIVLPQTKIIVLSMFGDEENFKRMLEIGVDGFLLKNAEIKELEMALQTVSKGQQYYSAEFMPFFTNQYVKKDIPMEDKVSKLTKREVEIIKYVAQGYINQEIADKLFISLRTVTTHRANINMKIGSKNTAQLIAYAVQNGMINF
ncbi:response regulator transcription factor [Labilibacter sediminis]|nr:response regulator transcription factor [Labilibacter sediminis]